MGAHRIAVLLGLLGVTLGHVGFKDLIPNGDRVVYNGNTYPGVGHSSACGRGSLNPFGDDFRDANNKWTEALCMADSDGDGRTNGEELGDPSCVWSPGTTPQSTTGITHPGYKDTPVSDPAATVTTTDCSAAGTGTGGGGGGGGNGNGPPGWVSAAPGQPPRGGGGDGDFPPPSGGGHPGSGGGSGSGDGGHPPPNDGQAPGDSSPNTGSPSAGGGAPQDNFSSPSPATSISGGDGDSEGSNGHSSEWWATHDDGFNGDILIVLALVVVLAVVGGLGCVVKCRERKQAGAQALAALTELGMSGGRRSQFEQL